MRATPGSRVDRGFTIIEVMVALTATVYNADGQPSVTLLVNGGEIAYQDIELSLEAGRPAIVISGTGRTADDIAGTPPATPRARALARSPLVQVIPATASAVLDALRRSLKDG